MINKNDTRFKPCTPDMKVPYPSKHGWYYTVGQPNTRIEGSATIGPNARVCGDAQVWGNARVCDNALVYGNAQVFGDAQVYGDARVCGNAQVEGGELVGTAVSLTGLQWRVSVSKPGHVRIGCQIHTFEDWLKPVNESPVPWLEHVKAEDVIKIKRLVAAVKNMESDFSPWKAKAVSKPILKRDSRGRFI